MSGTIGERDRPAFRRLTEEEAKHGRIAPCALHDEVDDIRREVDALEERVEARIARLERIHDAG